WRNRSRRLGGAQPTGSAGALPQGSRCTPSTAETTPSACHSTRFGAGGGGAGRPGSRRDMPRGEGPLQQVFQIGALAVLHVIDAPCPRRSILDAALETEQAPRLSDITRLVRHNEHRVDPLHRDDTHNTGERPVAP